MRQRPGLLVLLAATALLAGCATVQRHYEAALVLSDLAAGAGASRLKATTPPPAVSLVHYRHDDRRYAADLYRPGETALARLILVHGFTPLGKDDPRLRAAAETFARVRFAVLAPAIEPLRAMRVDETVADDLAAAMDHARRRGGRPVGVMAFSYAVGPAMIAAARLPPKRQPDFIVAVGGYYDIVDAIRYATTGYFRRLDGKRGYHAPDPTARWWFLGGYLDRLADPRERKALERVIEIKKRTPAADVSALVTELGREGRALYDLMANRDPARVAALIAALPHTFRRTIAALDLARANLGGLRAETILVHGLDDDIIPPAQSRALARALPPGRTHLFLVRGLRHVELRPGLFGRWRLVQAVATLLEQRRPDHLPAAASPGSLSMMTSTRRFWRRPWNVSLEAMGCSAPWPIARMRVTATPLPAR
jgi:pimeloyl-ACP methyl ester carboxylesterase